MKTIISLTVIFFLAFTANAQKKYEPIIKQSVFFGKSKAIRDVQVVLPGPESEREIEKVSPNPFPLKNSDISQRSEGPIELKYAQEYFGSRKIKGPTLNIEGISNVNNKAPADPNGCVGPDHYVQTVNNSTAVYDKNGNLIYGPVSNKSIFAAFPGPWNALYWVDPVFIYDELANRWVFTSISFNDSGPYYEMMAVSVSSDPIGEYYCYAFEFEHFNDYPKMSVWPSGYFITYNMYNYNGELEYMHSLITVVDRDAMLAGDTMSTMIQFKMESARDSIVSFSPLTANFKGINTPENTSCNLIENEFVKQNSSWNLNYNFYEIEPDWVIPENSTFTFVSQLDAGYSSSEWEPGAPQPGNFHNVEVYNSGCLMYPLTYRNFGDYEAMVGCQSAYDGEQYYILWNEFRSEGEDWYIYQSGNYRPDHASRYVPSITMNGKGDIGVVYTKSSLDIYPSICFTGRKAGDPLGEMTINELEIYRGHNYVNNYMSGKNRNRWGDYASIDVDPENDSTFWFTSMYPLTQTDWGNWSTRVVALDLTGEINAPYADAGPDVTICGDNMIFVTNADASNYSKLEWQTTGDGKFTDANEINTVYQRTLNEVENGQVKLSLTADGYEPGTFATDSMMLYFNKIPEVRAGKDDTICVNDSYYCQGEVNYSSNYYWTSTGDGSFNDSTSLNAIYTPAQSDTAIVWILFTLKALPEEPCAQAVADNFLLHVESCTGYSEFQDKRFFKVYPNPTSGMLTIELDKIGSEKYTIQVLDNAGKIIFNGNYSNHYGIIKKQVDFSYLSKGYYYITLKTEEEILTTKLIKLE